MMAIVVLIAMNSIKKCTKNFKMNINKEKPGIVKPNKEESNNGEQGNIGPISTLTKKDIDFWLSFLIHLLDLFHFLLFLLILD